MNLGDTVRLTVNPNFSTINRVGWVVTIIERKENNKPYLAVVDKLGVSWPLNKDEVAAL